MPTNGHLDADVETYNSLRKSGFTAIMTGEPSPRSRFVHAETKKQYTVLYSVIQNETNEQFVVYMAFPPDNVNDPLVLLARPLAEWKRIFGNAPYDIEA